MSWCDKLASTPAIGFKLDPHVNSTSIILEALSPLLTKLFDDETAEFSIEKHDPTSFGFNTTDGFKYGIDAVRTHVTFNHRMRARAVSGGAPKMELLSKPAPYSELLPNVANKLVEATLMVPGPTDRKVRRVGVVSTTQVAEDDLPPGIQRFIEYVQRPWRGELQSLEFSVVSTLTEDDHLRDRCIHVVKLPEDREDLVTLQFDWQRDYLSGRKLDRKNLEDISETAQRDAVAYFEQLGEGAMFDETIINSKSTT